MSTQLIEFEAGWFVRFYVGPNLVDEAGPFDDRDDAVAVQERTYG